MVSSQSIHSCNGLFFICFSAAGRMPGFRRREIFFSAVYDCFSLQDGCCIPLLNRHFGMSQEKSNKSNH